MRHFVRIIILGLFLFSPLGAEEKANEPAWMTTIDRIGAAKVCAEKASAALSYVSDEELRHQMFLHQNSMDSTNDDYRTRRILYVIMICRSSKHFSDINLTIRLWNSNNYWNSTTIGILRQRKDEVFTNAIRGFLEEAVHTKPPYPWLMDGDLLGSKQPLSKVRTSVFLLKERKASVPTKLLDEIEAFYRRPEFAEDGILPSCLKGLQQLREVQEK